MLGAAQDSQLSVRGGLSKRELIRQLRSTEGVECNPNEPSICRQADDCRWREDCFSHAPPLEELWKKVIGYWGMLAAQEDFLARFVAGDRVRALRDRLREAMLAKLTALRNRCRTEPALIDLRSVGAKRGCEDGGEAAGRRHQLGGRSDPLGQ